MMIKVVQNDKSSKMKENAYKLINLVLRAAVWNWTDQTRGDFKK